MSHLVPITIACAEYDRTRPIKDGRVRVDGCEVTYPPLDPEEHLVGIRKTLVEKYPWLPASVYKAFCQAKEIAIAELKEMSATKVTLPWPEVHVQDAVGLMSEDFWRYGVAENAKDIGTLARYSFEQGLAARKLTAEEIFHPSVFKISRV